MDTPGIYPAEQREGPEQVRETKRQLRRRMLERQRALPADYAESASAAIQRHILSLPEYRKAVSLFTYISMPREVSTALIIRQALADGKRLYVPKCIGGEMLAVRLRDPWQLRPGSYGIPEPIDHSETAAADELDLILVPCVSASPDGKRLGHGAGYYDRFLKAGSDRTFCLCFREMLLGDIPVEEHDIRMAHVISE